MKIRLESQSFETEMIFVPTFGISWEVGFTIFVAWLGFGLGLEFRK